LASDAPIPAQSTGCFLILIGAQLPQNVGAMLRTAEGAGVVEVWICEATTDPFGPKAVRGSSGSCFRVPVRVGMRLDQALERLQSAGITPVAATQNGTIDYDRFDWRKPAALVLGAEGTGFSTEQEALFTTKLRIPMAGKIESLNVATAAAVCLFEAARQRRAS
jgi:tRNA G18 (ribose-2'-O)-methylase SpoU